LEAGNSLSFNYHLLLEILKGTPGNDWLQGNNVEDWTICHSYFNLAMTRV